MLRLVDDVRTAVDRTARRYAPADDPRPLGGYVRAMAVFGVGVLGLSGVVARRGGPPDLSSRDLALSTVATFRAARLLTKGSVTAPLRAPVTVYTGPEGPAEVAEEVREPTGTPAHALGELLTCPYCVAMWLAAGFGFGAALAPRWTRFAASVLTIDAGADVLQKLYSDLQAR